jgi:hypothetical protein
VTAVAFMALVVACTALLCGHPGQPFPLRAACAWLRGRLSASHAPQAPGFTRAAQRPAERPLPAWAHTQPLDYEEAA